MMQINNEKNAIEIILRVLSHTITNEEEHNNIIIALENYQTGIIDEIYYCNPEDSLEPEEILRRAREKNKSIVLGNISKE